MTKPLSTICGHFEKGRWIVDVYPPDRCLSVQILNECKSTKQLDRIVDLLGVNPSKDHEYFVMTGTDGNDYALFDIIEKTLEKIGNGVE